MEDPSVTNAEPRMSFTLFPVGEPLPPQYRLVTVREVHDNREALRRAMPGWEIANLADGSVDGLSYGGHTRLERRNSVGHKLATQDSTITYTRGKMQGLKQDSSAWPCILLVFLIVLVAELIPMVY